MHADTLHAPEDLYVVRAGRCAYRGCGVAFDPRGNAGAPEAHFCDAHRTAGVHLLNDGWDLPTIATWPKCRYCEEHVSADRYDELIKAGAEFGDVVYCERHIMVEGRDPELIGIRGLHEGLQLLNTPDAKLIRWPMRSLHAMTGPLAPGRVTYVCAPPGGGKTTFVRNCIWHWVRNDGLRVRYLPLEASIGEVMAGFAAFMAEVSPDDALAFRLRDAARNGDERARVQLEELTLAFRVLRQDRDFLRRLQIEPLDALTPRTFSKALSATRALDADILVVDHVDHTESDPGDRSSDIQVSNHIQAMALRAAKLLQIHVLLFTQINTNRVGTDPLALLRVPRMNWLYNKGKKEQNAALFVGLHRIIDPNASTEMLRAVRSGDKEPFSVAMPNVMAATGMKFRYGKGTKQGTVLLDLKAGRLSSRPLDVFDAMEVRSVLDALPEVDLPASSAPSKPAVERPDSTLWMDR